MNSGKNRLLPKTIKLVLSALPLILAGLPYAFALSLEEVVVTAQKRPESAQDVPISITAISGEQLRLTGAGNLEGLSDSIPNVDISDSPGTTRVVIRGLGSGTGNPAFEQSVGMYVDGIYASRAALFQSPFLDLERIEVLKGPQGVLFGKNSIAGALSLISNRPTEEFEGEISASYDFEYDSNELTGYVSGPLMDGLYGRVAARTSQDEAYMTNDFYNHKDVPKTDTDVARGMFLWDATETTQVLLKVETSELDEHSNNWQVFADYSEGTFPYLVQNDPSYVPTTPALGLGVEIYKLARAGGEDFRYDDTSYLNDLGYLRQDADIVSLELTQAIGEAELVYLFGYGQYDRKQFTDVDFTAPTVANSYQKEDFDQVSHELRFVSTAGETVDYIAGLYYLDRNLNQKSDQDAVGFSPQLAHSITGSFDEHSTSYAAFTQMTWNISETWRANAGIRYSKEEKDAANWQLLQVYHSGESMAVANPRLYALLESLLNRRDLAYDDDSNESTWDPAFSVQWDFNDEAMAYASWVKASKAGGFNANEATGNFDNFSFEPENAESVEVGIKSTLLDGRARLNLAVFRTEFYDLQVGAFDPASGFVVRNAAKAVSQGVELEGLFAATPTITLGGNVGYLNAEYKDFTASCPNNTVQAAKPDCYPNPERPEGVPLQDLDGVQLDNAPELSAALFADYTTPITQQLLFGTRLDATYKDETSLDFSQDENLFAPDFWRLNLRFSLGSMPVGWNVALTIFNMTDEQQPNFGGQEALLPGVYWENRARGREVELSATYRFGQ